MSAKLSCSLSINDLTIGWQNWNLLSHPNATQALQTGQARASGENFNYMTLAQHHTQGKQGQVVKFDSLTS